MTLAKNTLLSDTDKILRLRSGLKRRSGVVHRSGFSFAEVMFAVVILGIGFIMVAAIFPIATEQTRSTADEAVAANMARDAVSLIQNATRADDYITTGGNFGITTSFAAASTTLWSEVSSNCINSSDPRYAWIPYFSQADAASPIRITVLVVRRWNHGNYTPSDLTADGNLVPRNISITSLNHLVDGTDEIEISKDSAVSPPAYQRVAPGTFIITTNGQFAIGDQPAIEIGRVFRIGQFKSETATSVIFALDPSEKLAVGETCSNVTAAVIGCDYKDLSDPLAGYDTASQDVAVYTTYLNPN